MRKPLGLALIAALALAPRAAHAALSDARWPQKVETPRGTLVLYRPVIESWTGDQVLVVRQANSFQRTGEDHRHYGTSRISVDTRVDGERGQVTLGRRQLLGLEVPSLDQAGLARAAAWRQEQFDQTTEVVPIAQLLSWVDRDRALHPDTPVVHPRPRVYLRTSPSQLVLLDGPPVFVDTEAEGVDILANSDTLIVRAARRVYLHSRRGWLEASSLAGPWLPRQGWPTPMLDLPPGGAFAQLQKLFDRGSADPAPEVLVDHHEVELVQIDGPPQLAPVPGTRLRWVTNTDSDLFTHPSRRGYFLCVSGRWFHFEGTDDLGEYVSDELPADFRAIPADHPRAHVLASVPGTPEAEDAVIAAGVPRFRTISPDKARFAPRFGGGRPAWRRITGTSVDEATNTSEDVLRIGDLWYGCDRGIWFASRNRGRSWSLIAEVPPEVAAIPPESSKHRLTYVDLTALEGGRVRAAVRGGYFGTYASGNVVVHGTGHDYEHTAAYYQVALARIREFYDATAADPLGSSRPSLLEPFYQRTYGYGFRYDPAQALFRPTRTGYAATRAPRPAQTAPTRITRDEQAAQTIYPGADGRLYRRSAGGGWQRLGPQGWSASSEPPRTSPQAHPARMGKLPPAPTKDPSSGPVQIGRRREPSGEGEARAPRPGPKRIGGLEPPKIKEGYDAYRWTNQYTAPPPAWVVPSYPRAGSPTQLPAGFPTLYYSNP